MEFDYHAYPTVVRKNKDGYEIRYDCMARVEMAGVSVYMDAFRAKEYGLNPAAPEPIPEFINDRYLDVQRDNGFGFLVYVTDPAHFDAVAVAASKVDGIAWVLMNGGDVYMRWENGVRVK